ncbi:coiled-coil domain-containing protein 74B-like isoform X6 [Dromaius novaehollandiae]
MAAAAAERGLAFLRQQHAEMLAELHEEIEYLKRENRDLHYKLIMNQSAQPRGNSTASQHSLKQRLRKKKSRKHEQSAEECVVQVAPGKSELRSQCMEKLTEEVPPRTTQIPAASSSSFLVNALPSWGLKPPTLGECQVVIRQLWSINQMQAQQIVYLKSCLENIHKTKRISGDYLITSQIGNPEVTRLPKLSHKDAPRKCLMAAPVPITEKTILPPLKQTLGNSFVERQKRTQAIQRSRLHRTAL